MSITLETEDLEQLKIRCVTALCDRDLHCFLPRLKADQKAGGGPCRKCKKSHVDFARTAKRDPKDLDYTFSSLKAETIRAKFWRKPISADVLGEARNAGLLNLQVQAQEILTRVVGSKPKGNRWDSYGTPFDGNILFLAQHATACCCRRCVQEWHGIPDDRVLTVAELDYLVHLVMGYVKLRVPILSEQKADAGRRQV